MYSKKYTLSECRTRILKLLERYSSNGIPNNCGEVRDIENRLITSLNIHLNKLWYEFSDTRCKSTVSFVSPVCIEKFGCMYINGGNSEYLCIGGKNSCFYLVAKGKGILQINSPSSSFEHRIDTDPGSYAVITGPIDSRELYDCDAYFYAETDLDIKEFVIYGDVPSPELLCGEDGAVALLPQDCSRIISLSSVYNGRELSDICEVLEDKRIIKITSEYSGEYVIEYLPYPPCFPDDADDSFEIFLSPVMFDALCYLCASDLCPANDNALYTKLTYKYREILENIYDRHRSYKMRNKFYGVISGCKKAFGKYER